MIDDLLDLTRTPGGTIPLKRARLDLQRLCDEVRLEVQAAHPMSSWIPGERQPDRRMGSDRLAQVVWNLLGNAIQHGAGRITLHAPGADESVTLSVHNSGSPIPLAVQATIRDRRSNRALRRGGRCVADPEPPARRVSMFFRRFDPNKNRHDAVRVGAAGMTLAAVGALRSRVAPST